MTQSLSNSTKLLQKVQEIKEIYLNGAATLDEILIAAVLEGVRATESIVKQTVVNKDEYEQRSAIGRG